MNKKALVVINPYAGMKKSKKNLFEIVDRLSKAGFSITTQTTTAPKDGTRMIRELGAEQDLIICCGGDGTLNEVINGVTEAGISCPIGYVPAGTTNDFARTLKLPKRADRCMDWILNGYPHDCDIGSFNGRNFTYIASLGAFTKVSYSTPQKLKNILGHTAYLLEGVKEVTSLSPFRAEIAVNGQTYEGDFLFGSISNSTSIGGLFRLNGLEVRLDDGEFELFFIRNPKSPIDLNRTVQAMVKGRYDPAYIIFTHCQEVSIRTEKPMQWTLDGESGGLQTEVQIKVQPDTIKLLY
ncbi:MAG: diacylglycerol kinase family lipid kinase [Clostridia bacterium]|nr:diacylglycerol kinase family lipid kinase [Clostridia bacterium]